MKLAYGGSVVSTTTPRQTQNTHTCSVCRKRITRHLICSICRIQRTLEGGNT